jgi:3D (Asp-Asp-Asp) domain-containing protein
MTQVASNNPTLLQRVIHVTAVALCTASSLALLGAVPAQWAMNRRAKQAAPIAVAVSAKAPATPVVETIVPQIASFKTGELLEDEIVEPVVPVAIAPAGPRTRVIRMEVTAYCPCTKCCGPNAQGITASGKPVSHNNGKFVAADTSVLPFGKQLVIPGYADGQRVEVIDRGGAIKGNKLDLYFDSHAEALVWGRQHLDVTVFE